MILRFKPRRLYLLVLTGCRPWSAAEHAAVIAGRAPCPICGGRPRAKSHYCLYDDRCGLDGAIRYPGEPVGSRMDPDYPAATPTAYVPAKLSGGVGRTRSRRVRPPAARPG